MKQQLVYIAQILSILMPLQAASHFDVSYVGFYKMADGIGRRAISQVQMLKNAVKVNFIPSQPGVKDDIDPKILSIFNGQDKTPGTVMIFVDTLHGHEKTPYYGKSSQCKIKYIYITIESTCAPASWVKIINKFFDGVLVPDEWSINSLKDSGVTKPIFVLPEVCFLESFLQEPLQEKPHQPFTFGVTATAWPYKNYDLLLEAFAAEFKNSADVKLKTHNTFMKNAHLVERKIEQLGLSNITATHGPLNMGDYKAHMKSIDCYVLVSKGEGFSLTPREALALGRPCILANHTAQKTLCKTGFVRPVPATIIEKHDGNNYSGEDVCTVFNCSVDDLRAALRDVYENYNSYVSKAIKGREWVQRYLAPNLLPRYLSVIKPKRVLFGENNEATDEYLMTNSRELYNAYMKHVMRPRR